MDAQVGRCGLWDGETGKIPSPSKIGLYNLANVLLNNFQALRHLSSSTLLRCSMVAGNYKGRRREAKACSLDRFQAGASGLQ